MDAWVLSAWGFALLVFGGEALVRGVASAARALRISPVVAGVLLVFGTAGPELVTSLQAAFSGSPGIAVGNVVGSNTANVLLILGTAAAIGPVVVERRAWLQTAPFVLAAAAAAVWATLRGGLDGPVGAVFLGGLAVYFLGTWAIERGATRPAERLETMVAEFAAEGPPEDRLGPALLTTVFALVAVIVGARLLVAGGVMAAEALGVSETLVGLTLVAIGTSLPEYVTAVIAALKRESAIAYGNIAGSFVYNVLGVLGLTALVQPVPVPPEIAAVDIWVMTAAAAALIVCALTGGRISRREGALMVLAYLAYLAWLAAGA